METHRQGHLLNKYFPKSHAYLVGINQYPHLDGNDLQNAINDVRGIARLLEQTEVHNFIVHSPLLDASYQELLELIQVTIPNTVKEGDRVLFYFAGHGVASDRIDENVPEGYLLPSNAALSNSENWLAMRDLHEALNALECKHLLLVLDCCFSGAFQWADQKRDAFRRPKKNL